MPSISNTGPLSPLNPRPGNPPVRIPQPALPATAPRAIGDSFQAPTGLAATAGGISAIERSVHAAQSTIDDLDRVGSLLDDLRVLVGDAGRRESDSGLSEIQSRIDSIIGTISDASAQAVAARQPTNAALPLGYSLFRNESITTNASGYAKFAQGQEAFGLDVVVTTSAQQGGFFLSFGASELSLGAYGGGSGNPNFFVLEVAGNRDVQQFSFASGASLSDVASAINSQAGTTGAQAYVSGTGIVLKSFDYGSDQFVSVRIIEHGFLQRPPDAGIYQLDAFDTNAANPTGRLRSFSYSPNPLVDYGQDVQATIGGVQAITKGLNIRAAADNWRVSIDLNAYFAAGIRQSTPVAWFFPNPAPDAEGAAPEGALSPAQEVIPGATGLISGLRDNANDRLAQLKEQLRAALGTPQKPDEKQSHLETLAALRRSLLGEPPR